MPILPCCIPSDSFAGVRRSRTCLAVWLLSMAAALTMPYVHAQTRGIVIYKESSSHPDGTAKVFEYFAIRPGGEATNFDTVGGKVVRLTKFQPHSTVAYPEFMNRTITEAAHLAPIENGLRSYLSMINRYPRVEPFLRPYVTASEEIIRRVKGGEVFLEGAYMTAGDYQDLIRNQKEAANREIEEVHARNRASAEQARRSDMESRRRKR